MRPSQRRRAERRRFFEMNPKDQVLTKTDLAKSENAWRELPQVVSRGAQKNFRAFADNISEEWKAHPDDFNEDYFRAAVGRVVLFRSLQTIVTAQPWYSGGYRANVVSYAMSKLAQMIREQAPKHTLDANAIWSNRRHLAGTPRPASDRRQGHARRDHRPTSRHAERHRVGQTGPLLGDSVGRTRFRSRTPSSAELVSKTASGARQAGPPGRSSAWTDGIGAQEAVIALGQAYWARSRTWASERGFLSAWRMNGSSASPPIGPHACRPTARASGSSS